MANYSSIPFFLPLLSILITTTTVLENVVVKGDPDLTFLSTHCGTEQDVNSLIKNQASRLIDDAVRYTQPGFTGCGGTLDEPITNYRTTCSDFISRTDCRACISYAADQVVNQNLCDGLYFAQLTVASCSLTFATSAIADCSPLP